jgi:hypothetical protein
MLMVFKAAFNNISVISLRLHLLVEETEYPEKTTNLSQVTEKLYHIYTGSHSVIGHILLNNNLMF